MSAEWFFTEFAPSRSVIENTMRLSFWKAGLGQMWFSCVKDASPFVCDGMWGDDEFSVEWEPKNYLLLKMKSPNDDLLRAFERVLKHKALAAYKKDDTVWVEWRVKNGDVRFEELQSASVAALERLNK